LVVSIVFEDLILLVLEVLILQLLDDLLLFGTPLRILQVIHVQLVLQVVNVRVLFNIGAIETFKFSLQSLVLLLELWLDILDSLEALIGAFELDASPLDGVLQDSFVTAQRLHSLLHFFHLACLSVDDVSDTFFNVLLLRVLVQIATDGVEELERLVARSPHFSLSS